MLEIRSGTGNMRKTIITPSRGWRMLDVGELRKYRELLWVLILRDVQVRYKQTVLGGAWVILRPVLGMAVFTTIGEVCPELI